MTTTLYKNPDTKIIFASDDAQSGSIVEIQSTDIAALTADGYTVDSSADSYLPTPDATASGEATPTSADAMPVTSATNTDMPTNTASSPAATDATPVSSTATEGADTVATPTAAETQATNTADAATTSAADQKAAEQAVADAGVDTTKDVGTVTLTPTDVGSLAGTAVTPGGVPVVEAQPQAVTVAGPTYPANSPVVAAASTAGVTATAADGSVADPVLPPTYADASDHKSLLEVFLRDMEGIPAMGKAEIHMFVDFVRNAVKKL